LDKQKKGKKRMLEHGKGSVAIPPEAFIKVLRRG
jgi:translation elongation factor EF-4